MFGKLMSVSDELMFRYYELLSACSLKELSEIKSGVAKGTMHPKMAKENIAPEITGRFYGNDAAMKAKEMFDKQFKKKEIPEEIPEFELESGIWICKALVDTGLEKSTSQARRDIKQGAVRIDKAKVDDEQTKLAAGEYVLQVGKRKFAKAKVH